MPVCYDLFISDEVFILRAPAELTLDQIRTRVREAVQRSDVERAYLFGSHARGTADVYSDLDLVVVMPAEGPFVERGKALPDLAARFPMAVELLVYTPEEFEEGWKRGFGMFDVLRREGVLIYERQR